MWKISWTSLKCKPVIVVNKEDWHIYMSVVLLFVVVYVVVVVDNVTSVVCLLFIFRFVCNPVCGLFWHICMVWHLLIVSKCVRSVIFWQPSENSFQLTLCVCTCIILLINDSSRLVVFPCLCSVGQSCQVVCRVRCQSRQMSTTSRFTCQSYHVSDVTCSMFVSLMVCMLSVLFVRFDFQKNLPAAASAVRFLFCSA